jgi:hypothetical protein
MITFKTHRSGRRNIMNLETIQIPAFVAVIFAVTTFLLVPTAAMAMSKLPVGASEKKADSTDGAACELPPFVDIEGHEGEAAQRGLPPLDKEVTEKYKTATFAMG